MAVLLLPGCELREVAVAEPQDVVVAEVILRAGDPVQTALLHRTLRSADGSAAVPGAAVEVLDDAGRVLPFEEAVPGHCFRPREDGQLPWSVRGGGTCYVADGDGAFPILPGARYHLRIRLPDGGELTGATRVPGEFRIVRPAAARCRVAPDARLTLAWTPAAGAWAYPAEATFQGLREAYAERGIAVPEDPLTLLGLAVSAADTTMALPGAFGVFDRFDRDLAPALVALQHGIPGGVAVDVVVAATDRNFVNWARGGNFNPSGQVRVPSVLGAGTGVFGSLVPRRVRVETGGGEPVC